MNYLPEQKVGDSFSSVDSDFIALLFIFAIFFFGIAIDRHEKFSATLNYEWKFTSIVSCARNAFKLDCGFFFQTCWLSSSMWDNDRTRANRILDCVIANKLWLPSAHRFRDLELEHISSVTDRWADSLY